MGASTAILYSATDPNIVALCLDSPFSNLNELCNDLMNSKVRSSLFSTLDIWIFDRWIVFWISKKTHKEKG